MMRNSIAEIKLGAQKFFFMTCLFLFVSLYVDSALIGDVGASFS